MAKINEEFLNRIILNQYQSVKDMMLVTGIYILLAVLSFIGLPLILKGSVGSDLEKWLGLSGGTIFTGLGFTPAKEILDRRQQLRNLEAALPLYHSIHEPGAEIDALEKEYIEKAFAELFKKAIFNE